MHTVISPVDAGPIGEVPESTLEETDAAMVRWMNQSGDPVIRYALDGDTVAITQTLPDGTTERTELAVPAEEEAR